MGSNVNQIQSLLLQAQSSLERAKDAKKQAQGNNNYKNATKNISIDGKTVNCYDYDIIKAQKLVKEYKTKLSEAKKAAKKK